MQNADAEAPKTVPKTELKLDYARSDALPELPGLASTAATGCVFCEVLRHDLMAPWESIEAKGEENEGDEVGNESSNSDGEEKESGGDVDEEEEDNEDTNKARYEYIDTDSDAESEPDTEADEEPDDKKCHGGGEGQK
ncbi:uncharacterized protein BKA55DRAFT_687255 [Fusarium redolens]|uniref:Uncharacterized protein n=1 Tax=Fusarium redolens TaxID=48865 RepID=A0A9P9HKL8_FUSRE|nr:uncharacterized protein BKA55DRAFT_687255 [Fusarium redolens]KAH7258966.1 hypothetical protein BKA55DRAFT_687255 [Fusarium redolens]